jgi:hypothetical protein
MLKKVFGIAGVGALLGVVVCLEATGCGGPLILPDEGGTAAPTPTTTGRVPPSPPPPGWDEPPQPPDDPFCPSTTPITAKDIDAQMRWLPPAAIQNVCTQQNIDDLKALFKSTGGGVGVKFADIKVSLGATCSACVFSPIAGPTWQVFVEEQSGAVDNRTGSCFAQLGDPECGKKRFQFETCLDIACSEADCGFDSTGRCQQKAQKGACRELTEAYAKACPTESDLLETCGNIFSAIAASCSGGADAGIDASTN